MNELGPRLSAALRQGLDSDFVYSFTRSPTVVAATVVAVGYVLSSMLAPWIAPHQVFDVKTLNLLDAFTPPVWEPDGRATFLLGTDDQGRDVFSTIMFGSRVSPCWWALPPSCWPW